MTKRTAIYVRVSTSGQSVEKQLADLNGVAEREGWNVVKVYKDKGVSGAKGRDQRPAFDKLCKAAARREFDLIAAWSLDRIGRTLIGVVQFLDELHALGVDLFLYREGADTRTPAGRMYYQMAGVFAEFERNRIRERVQSGMDHARATGTKSGRPIGRPRVSPEIEAAVRKARGEKKGIHWIAREVGCGVGTVQRIIAG